MEIHSQRVSGLLDETTERLEASGSETARLDAEVLLGYILGVDRSVLMAHPEAVISTGQLERFEPCVARRAAGEPVAYIRGMKEFYGAAITVDRRVLIPRPETESLVTLALERIVGDLTGGQRPADAEPYLIWDIGTGSGAIPLAIGSELRRRRYGDAVRFFVSDASGGARDVATINAVSHGLAHLFTFAEGDLVDVAPAPPGRADLLVANLPYIPSGAMAGLPVAVSYEPTGALDGGPDGLDVIRRLLPSLPDVLSGDGAALLEIGGDQAELMSTVAAELLPGWTCTVKPDLSGSPRVAELVPPDA
jgi:release factor glutamine methyltransferase